MTKECILCNKACTNCGECSICDLDGTKICTNCGKCIDSTDEYRTVNIKEFISIQEEKEA
ncbi:MAG: hypothetical protein N2489_05435 [Clostridia bacterium]|nr:hypothetical protein [Clostridia bacterium]